MEKIPHKIKIEDTPIGKPVKIQGHEGESFTIETIFTTSESPNKHLRIFDSEGDIVSWPFPGSIEPKPVSIDAVTVKLPITIVDDEGGNEIILRGYLSPQHSPEDE